MAGKSTRRDFLEGKSAADAMADLVHKTGDLDCSGGPPGEAAAGAYLLSISRRAMACEFEVYLNAGQYENGTEAALEALDLVERLEAQMSVFREESEVSRLNRSADRGPVAVEPGLFDLLELAGRLHTETQGAFDVTSAPLWKAWGFARRDGTVPTPEQLAEAMQRVGGDLLECNAQDKTIQFRRPGVEMNLGSIGKGYALDCARESLAGAGVDDFLFHGGQSSVLGQGSKIRSAGAATGDAAGDEAGGWTVGLRHPLRQGERLAEIRLRDRALSTSGSRFQSFRQGATRYGHILDPRTGRPAQGVLSATAIAPSAAVADALSTAFYVMGPEGALEYCRARSELAAILVCPAQSGGGLEIHSTGLEEKDLRVVSPLG